MRIEVLFLCCLGLPVAPAIAASASADPPLPAFTATERAIVARNELLAHAVAADPWTVRRWLDRMARHPVVAPHVEHGPAPPPDGFDPAQNPDISATERGSADGTYDLIQLIKRAAPPATTKPQ